MTRREHEIRREILARLEARMAEDPFFRLYELGLEAGQMMLGGDDRKRELERNFQEARQIILYCRQRAAGPCCDPPQWNGALL